MWLGLDYTALIATAKAGGWRLRRRELDDLQAMELAALEELNRET